MDGQWATPVANPHTLEHRIKMRVAILVEFHVIDAPTRLGFLECDLNSSIDGDSDRRLTIDNSVLSEENALARRAGEDHVDA